MTTNPAPAAVYAVKQRITPMVNRYEFSHADAEGNPTGTMLAFAQQKRMKLKEEVIFYTDDTKSTPVFSFKARNVLDVSGTTDIYDEHGRTIGTFRKDFKASLIRSTWFLEPAGRAEVRGEERDMLVALLRRFTDITFIPYHFDFKTPEGTLAFSVEKKWGLRDKYKVTVWDGTIDWRAIAAMAVALDALQAR